MKHYETQQGIPAVFNSEVTLGLMLAHRKPDQLDAEDIAGVLIGKVARDSRFAIEDPVFTHVTPNEWFNEVNSSINELANTIEDALRAHVERLERFLMATQELRGKNVDDADRSK